MNNNLCVYTRDHTVLKFSVLSLNKCFHITIFLLSAITSALLFWSHLHVYLVVTKSIWVLKLSTIVVQADFLRDIDFNMTELTKSFYNVFGVFSF